ncbi:MULTISPECIES: endonuclease/exonuclease/phosphatase family protein [Actinoplanes]|uniref:endonuclease/exonuclease/phosphatase family protein n=1 Tax=Actinoplanes TaxID=1865 RepID=UPI0005F2A38F|nr:MULTISPECIES: endonuclease/exonuclease/phosphatase family protein [Actinoplanes]GLY01596.1 hypothetical protein Acsp01_19750 [Actinoplanes sp. NBRC 101535]
MRLLTFNTLYKGDVAFRLRALGPFLAEYDVVCLQEFMYRRNVRVLREVAPGFRHYLSTGSVVIRGGLVLLSRLPVVRHRFVRYPMSGPVRPEFFMRKGAQLATIAAPAGEWTVVNTHLSANLDDDWSPENRYTRVERAELDHLAAALPADGPLVVVGDLNLPRKTETLAWFREAAGLTDAMAGDTRPTYRPTTQWPNPPAFDHVLVRGARAEADLVLTDEVALADGRRAYLSDHYGIGATITLD